MGYTTDFNGRFDVKPALDEETRDYLDAFSRTRRMARDPKTVKEMDPDWESHCFKGQLGPQAAYYVKVDDLRNYGQGDDASILDYNRPPEGQPGLWCQWVPSPDSAGIEWDGGEKFYNYIEWLAYIIDNFLAPSGHVVNGTVRWRGEEFDDVGMITVRDNEVSWEYLL